jgi:uncharacterized BrkB/YihY/UPF0761 family membrane protein
LPSSTSVVRDSLTRDKVPRPPRWYGVPVRVLMLTFIATLLSFSVILLFSIFGTVIVSALKGVHPDMRIAYRHIALPLGLVVGGMILVIAIAGEVRNYRQAKALRAIERMR